MGKEKLDANSCLVDIPLPQSSTVLCQNIVELLDRRLKEHLLQTAYNSVGMLFQHRKAAASFSSVDSYAYYQQFSSSNCIGLTLGLIEHIINYCRNRNAIMNLPPLYVIPATLPPHYGRSEGFGHVALLILCSDGVILLDSGFHIPKAIVLKQNEIVSLRVGEKTWRFQLKADVHYRAKPCIGGVIHASVETPTYGREYFKYTLRHISHPDGIIIKTIDNTERVSFVRRDWDGLQTSHVTLYLKQQLVKMAFLKKEDHKYHKGEIIFSEDESDIFDIRLRLYGCPPTLIEQIKYILRSTMEERKSIDWQP